MNSYQILEQETKEAVEIGDEVVLKNILRRIKNLTVSPSCAHYPWDNLINLITPKLKQVDADIVVNGILEMRRREKEQLVVNRIAEEHQLPVDEIEDLSDEFLQSWSSATQRGKKGSQRYHG